MTVHRHSNTRPGAPVRAHRVAVDEEAPQAVAPPNYADAFEVASNPTDPRSAEEWARDGFDRLPLRARQSALLAHRWILGFHLGPWVSPGHIFGWPIVISEPEQLHLEARSHLFRGRMVWRLHGERLVMTTFLRYERHQTAAAVWCVLGNVHRAGAPGLLQLAAGAANADKGRRAESRPTTDPVT
jgi:hypothetical protein